MCIPPILQAVVLYSDADDVHWDSAPYEELVVDVPLYLINVSLTSPAKVVQKQRFEQASHAIRDSSWYKCSGENETAQCSLALATHRRR